MKMRAAVIATLTMSMLFAPHIIGAKRRAVRSVTPAPAPQSHTIVLTPSRDNTLYESDSGSVSNGAGVHLFAGNTQSRSKRRALVMFDVAAQIPAGSLITRAVLTLHVSTTISGPQPVTLHRVTSEWGEGTSNAGFSRDGNGVPSQTNDATWIHRFFPSQQWITAGGDFDSTPLATAQVGSTTGVWESAAMATNVQSWLDAPATNRGWLLRGNESTSGSAKRFDSRESGTVTSRPSLLIEYQH
ncbi:MAG TPA: DNRLRE domain-containing protein [Thermoanaerobaculia bacterium]|nr:DNRLRE domain-containing protein [Thermoanaerobaculia bacterium]